MEADDQEIMDLPMMSNRDISLVTHYIIDLSCDMKSKSFTGSITLFMQPAPKSTSLLSGSKTPYVICSSNFSNQNETSQGKYSLQTKKLSASEQTPSSDNSKTDLKVGVHNQQICHSATDVCHSLNCAATEDEDSLKAGSVNKDLQGPSINVNVPGLQMADQNIDELVQTRGGVKIGHHCLSSHDDKVNVSSSDINNSLIKDTVPSSLVSCPKIGIPAVDADFIPNPRTFPFTSSLSPDKNSQEETQDKVRFSDGKRKISDDKESPLNSKHAKLNEKMFLLNETWGMEDIPVPVGDQTSDKFVSSNPKSKSSAPYSNTDLSDKNQPFVLILDACNIHVSQVKLLELPNCGKCTKPCLKCRTANMTQLEQEKFFRFCSSQPGQNLRFSTTKWSLNIWDERQPPERFDARLPFVVRIEYSTLPEGKSLKWVADQDGNMTVFTRGDFINNRSLFPSQDHPETLSTWQAYITVTVSDVVLMTGDQEAVVTQQENGFVQFYYQSSMLMPSSTVAIAVGQWQSSTIYESESLVHEKREKWIPDFCSKTHRSCSVNFSQHPILPCRVFAPKSLLTQVEAEFQHYLPKCLAEMHNIFGPHPFCRLDILLVPSCFESLGMANPCLIFLSESILVGNCSFCCRLSHEISHSWFGLILGPKDWTEEWMTEGFASFVEDLVHPKVIGMNEKEAEDWFELRALIKYRVLTAELSHTNDELQIMRINESDAVANRTEENGSVKNGLNPDKKCLQVHYLKGYFLLRFFSQKVGLPHFKIFLRKYVHHFHGQLVSSQDFLQLLFKEFPELREEDLDEKCICDEWLDRPGLPKVLQNLPPNKQAKLINDVYQQFEAITWGLTSFSGLKLKLICEDQLTLLLELLLDVPCNKLVLEKLYQEFHISEANPDVRHRWCELVVKHKFTKFYKDVKHFLLHDQAMGIYLFGELMLSNSTKQKLLAKECFHLLKDNMDDRLKKSVEELIYG